MTIPTHAEIPAIVAESDLVAAIPRRWYEQNAQLRQFCVRPLPLAEVVLGVVQRWDPRHERQPAERCCAPW